MLEAEAIVLPFRDFERVSGAELEEQKHWVADYRGLDLLYEFPVAVMVFNVHRQIVYINAKAKSFLADPHGDPFGLRPGEAFGCIHARETAGGCGTAKFCRFCGAAQGIASALSGAIDLQQCQIDRTRSQHHDQLDLLVWTKPFITHNQVFILAALIDISAEQRRDTFERIFLHDILNTASSIQSVLYLIDDKESGVREYLDLAKIAAEQLTEEIQTHRSIWDAEHGSLSVNASVVSVSSLLQKVGTLYNYMAEERGIQVVITPCGEKKIISDEVLLKRVVSNLVKNAIEACKTGDVVELRCFPKSDAVIIQIKNPAVISEEVQANIFKRAYSTKAKGRGWGTYAARLFVEDYLGGRISYVSNPEQGTIFTIQLPDDPVFPPGTNS
ncbi:sensor histidine kinase [Gracilinema caldarium]|uniref:histidine kinase n=1 Tax=Gracilinema caldarium (strain ATCC 51460 / DSM 7334 / H1) TaxID=744872 RepID=F8F448_GRAC1|nr:HAMP domain-containing sensor histidine kinase [Gracilinema caldarium]AEJ20067.1 histidine kinase [Gracilinema caldarium DSM 7334]